MAPASKITAAKRLDFQPRFKADLYVPQSCPTLLYCKACESPVDHSRPKSMTEHLNTAKHERSLKRKRERNLMHRRQGTIEGALSAATVRCEITQDFIAMCAEADIPIHKSTKMRPFIRKHCKSGGVVPGTDALRKIHLPKVYNQHIEKLRADISGKKVYIAVDETTDDRGESVLNIVDGFEDERKLIDTIFMDRCNATTVSQAVLTSLNSNGIDLNNVLAFCTDNAAYCKAAFRIMQPLLPNCHHVLCLAHVVNLVGEAFQHQADFANVNTLVWTMKTILNVKKGARRRRFIQYLRDNDVDSPHMPPQPVQMRWNTWFEAVQYHQKHMHLNRGFFEAEESDAQSVERLITILTGDSYAKLVLQVSFIADSCDRLMTTLTQLETSKQPIATRVYDLLDDLESVLRNGCTKVLFGDMTDDLLRQLRRDERNAYLDCFHNVYISALSKLSKHWDVHLARKIYKYARIFDPRKVRGLRNLDAFANMFGIDTTADALDEWFAYREFASSPTAAEDMDIDNETGRVNIVGFWKGYGQRFPILCRAAVQYMWYPVGSVDVERSFSAYKNLLSNKRYGLTRTNTKNLVTMYFNRDIVGRWEGYNDQ